MPAPISKQQVMDLIDTRFNGDVMAFGLKVTGKSISDASTQPNMRAHIVGSNPGRRADNTLALIAPRVTLTSSMPNGIKANAICCGALRNGSSPHDSSHGWLFLSDCDRLAGDHLGVHGQVTQF